MNLWIRATILCVLIVVVLLPETIRARPAKLLGRQKRVSDQRLAELETLLALQNLKGIVLTVPIGYGKVNPALLGRKRRSTLLPLPEGSGGALEKLQRLGWPITQRRQSTRQQHNRPSGTSLEE